MNEGKTILMVEDEQDIVAMYELKFTSNGYTFHHCNSNAEGLKLARQHTPDVILLDIKLGDEEGIDLLEQLKSDEATKDIPVIMFSNAYQKEYEKKALEMGAKEYVLKAKILPDEMLEKIKQYM